MQHQITLELSAEKAFEYQKAILAVLAKVEVPSTPLRTTSTQRKAESIPLSVEYIKIMYELLGKLDSGGFKVGPSTSSG